MVHPLSQAIFSHHFRVTHVPGHLLPMCPVYTPRVGGEPEAPAIGSCQQNPDKFKIRPLRSQFSEINGDLYSRLIAVARQDRVVRLRVRPITNSVQPTTPQTRHVFNC